MNIREINENQNILNLLKDETNINITDNGVNYEIYNDEKEAIENNDIIKQKNLSDDEDNNNIIIEEENDEKKFKTQIGFKKSKTIVKKNLLNKKIKKAENKEENNPLLITVESLGENYKRNESQDEKK